MTDTCTYNRDAFVRGFATKVVTLPHLRMALATSGRHVTSSQVSDVLLTLLSFDEIIDQIPDLLRESSERGEFEHFGDDFDDFRLVITGWSDRVAAMQLYTFDSYAHDGMEAFAPVQLASAVAPALHLDVLREAGLFDGDMPVISNPEEWLTKVTDCQRRRRIGDRGSAPSYSEPPEGAYVVGGAAVLTKVTKHGIVQRVVRRWPDQLDAYIEPHGAS
jgi:hypothetical protein